jgi:riboflavin transporter FmnP
VQKNYLGGRIMNVNNNTKKMVTIAMLMAVSVVLVAFIHFPIMPAAPFLEYDPADIPIFIGTFLFGPAAGFIITVITSLIQGFTVSAQSGIYGILMHIFATGSFVLVAGNIYKRNMSKKGAILSLVAGVITMTVAMLLFNTLITPIFMGVPRSAVISMLIPVFLRFNLIRAGANAVVTYLIYKPLRVHVFKFVDHKK